MPKLPSGRLGRLAGLARVGARTGASLLLSRDGSAAANQAAEILGGLRGLAAKVGQMASYVDGFVPEPHREAYEKALRKLQNAAPHSSEANVRRVIEGELGAPVDELFASWDPVPFASASIGQVHRATLHDGREVAVKVQHPGIETAVENDLKNAGLVERLVGTLGPANLDSKVVFDEIADRFREELDYELEARHQRRFAEIHAGDPFIRVPGVIAERSGRRVLTSELVSGMSLEQAAQCDEERRRHYAEVLWRFVFKGNLVAGMFNADPHPGNYIFGDDGTVAFLDFGCIQPFEQEVLAHARGAHCAALAGDDANFAHHAKRIAQTRGGAYEEAFVAYLRQCLSPLRESPYRITGSYVSELVSSIMQLKREAFSEDGNFVQFPRGTVLLNRLQFGFYSVLARLDVPADYATVEREFLDAAGLLG